MMTKQTTTITPMAANPPVTLGTQMMTALSFVRAAAPTTVSARVVNATKIATAFNFQPPSYTPTEDIMVQHSAYVPAFTAGARAGFETRLKEIVQAGNLTQQFVDEKLHEIRWPDMIGAGLVTFNTTFDIIKSIEFQGYERFNRTVFALEYPVQDKMPLVCNVFAYLCAALGIYVGFYTVELIEPDIAFPLAGIAYMLLGGIGVRYVKRHLAKRNDDLITLGNLRTIKDRLFIRGYYESLETRSRD